MPDEAPMIVCFYGRPIEELSRDELLDAVRFLAALVHEIDTPEAARANALARVDRLKRGLHA